MPSHIDNTRQMLQAIRAQLGVLRASWIDSHRMEAVLDSADDYVKAALRELGEEARDAH